MGTLHTLTTPDSLWGHGLCEWHRGLFKDILEKLMNTTHVGSCADRDASLG